MKKILVAILTILISTTGCSKKTNSEDADANSDEIGKSVTNAALQVSGIDVSTLSGVTEKIKGACSRNKYGLSEEVCIQTVDDRKDFCMQQTAQKYPGKLSNVDRMQEVISSHIECLFQK